MILAIGGEPATGKTALVSAILDGLPPGRRMKVGLVVGTTHEVGTRRVLVLGDGYRERHPFAGTDRLSMGVMPAAREFLPAFVAGGRSSVLFEGDRLVTADFVRFCRSIADARLWVLWAPPEVLDARHKERRDRQQAAFLRGRATKYRRILEAGLGDLVSHWTPADREALAARALGLLRGQPEPPASERGDLVPDEAERPA